MIKNRLVQFGLIMIFLLICTTQITAIYAVPTTETTKRISVTPTPVSDRDFAIQGIFSKINMVRAENNAQMLIFDDNLANAARNFASYLLEIGHLSEEGLQGETEKTRAEDVGYGGGASFNITQNIAMVWTDTTPDYLVNSIWGADPNIRQKLLDVKGQHIGIGIADDRQRRFVVVMIGYLLDGSVQYTPLPTYDVRTPKPEETFTPSPVPLITSTRQPDGSIMHEIQSGQTLSEIAYAYKVDWYSLAQLNDLDLDDPVIFEGEKLIIQPTFTITPTPTLTNTPRPPTRTPRPTYTAFTFPSQTIALIPETGNENPALKFISGAKSFRYEAGLLLVFFSAIGLILSLFLIKRK